MKLSKKDREMIKDKIARDMETWESDTVLEWGQNLCKQELEELGDQDLVDEFAEVFGYDKCEHCGHVDATGACFHCKMD